MKIGKHIFSVGIMTAFSRIAGFIRDILIARILGAGNITDIFFTAFKIPNLFRDLLGEGALSSIFIPMFKKEKENKYFAYNVFSWLMFILLLITIISLILMPFIIHLLAPGFDAEKIKLTVSISRIMFIYVIFICGSAFISALLNSFSRFTLVAFMPIMLNITLITALLFSYKYNQKTILFFLTFAVLLSGFFQIFLLWFHFKRKHFTIKLIFPQITSNIKELFKKLSVSIIGSGFYQLTIIIGTLVASFDKGGVSYLYYSDRIIQLPFAVIGLAVGTVLISSISSAFVNKDYNEIYRQQNNSITNSLMLIFPSMIGLIILSKPIIKLLFEYGNWSSVATSAVSQAIMIQALVLPAMLISQIYTKTLFASGDVKTPVKTSIVSLLIAIIIYLSLYKFIGYLAVPVGIVISGYIKNYMLRNVCKKKKLICITNRTIISSASFFIIASIMGSFIYFINVNSIINLVLVIMLYGILYLPISYLTNKYIQKHF